MSSGERLEDKGVTLAFGKRDGLATFDKSCFSGMEGVEG